MVLNFFKKYKSYIVSVAIALGVGLLSAFFTRENMDLFDVIEKPPLTPPALLFPIVWTILYVLMGISSARVFENREKDPRSAREGLTYYASSLVLNFGFSIIFFNIRAFLIAALWTATLLFFIIKTIILYKKADPLAAYLQIPYAIWVAFATYLTVAISFLN